MFHNSWQRSDRGKLANRLYLRFLILTPVSFSIVMVLKTNNVVNNILITLVVGLGP